MGWSADFITALQTGPYRPAFLLRRIQNLSEPGYFIEVSSHPPPGSAVRLGGIRVEGQSVSPRTWAVTVGAFSVEIVGDPTDVLFALPRGAIVELIADFDGVQGRIAVGQVRTFRGTAPSMWLECLDLFSALRSSLDTGEYPLFTSVAASTTTTILHAVGAAVYTVADTTGFEKQTGGLGAIKITTTLGFVYYRIWSAKTATTFTIEDPTDATVMGTTDGGALSGSTVSEVGYIYAHPSNIALNVLCSTGGGANGPFDVLPAGWGIGVLSALVDELDASDWKNLVTLVASGSYVVQTPVTAPIANPLTWLLGILSPLGMWLTMRQGKITFRSAQDTHAVGFVLESGYVIRISDVVSVEDYDAYDVDHEHEYESCKVTTFSGTVTKTDGAKTATLPGGGTNNHDASAYVFENVSAIGTEAALRMVEADTRIPERLVLRLRGLSAAVLCPGDVLTLELGVPTGLSVIVYSRTGAAGFGSRVAVVHEVSPDWLGGTVRIGVWVYPDAPSAALSSEVA